MSEDQSGRKSNGYEATAEEFVAEFHSDDDRARMRCYQIEGTRCERCESEGPFLLDPDEEFAVEEDGTIHFPPGEWGLDIDCQCPACGFSARLGDFYEWVEVTGKDRS
jgi:hypothetical protein